MLFRKKLRNRRLERREILKVKVRASVRRQTWLRRVGILLGGMFALLFGLILAWRGIEWVLRETVYTNPAFALHQFDVQTDGVIPIEQLRSWSGVRLRDNLLALDLARVQRDLEMVPAIETVQVERILPHTLRIRVTERVPVARMIFRPRAEGNAPGEPTVYTIDAAGYFMFPIDTVLPQPGRDRVADHLPVLTGVPLNEVRPGRATESSQLRAALQLLQSFERSAMNGRVQLKEIDVKSPGFLTVLTGHGCTVVFGLTGFDQQLRRWQTISDHGQRFGRSLAWMDLSVSNNVPIQWREEPPAAPAPPRGVQSSEQRSPHV